MAGNPRWSWTSSNRAARARERQPTRSARSRRPDEGPAFLSRGRSMRPDRRHASPVHPIWASIVAIVGRLRALAAADVLAGWLLKTYALPEHGLGHADEHVNVWLAHTARGLGTTSHSGSRASATCYAIPASSRITALVAVMLRRWRVAGVHRRRDRGRGGDLPGRDTRRSTASGPHVPRLDDLPVERELLLRSHGGVGRGVLRPRAADHVACPEPRRAGPWSGASRSPIPLLVALSRMYRGMHHPTDVAAGAPGRPRRLVVAHRRRAGPPTPPSAARRRER